MGSIECGVLVYGGEDHVLTYNEETTEVEYEDAASDVTMAVGEVYIENPLPIFDTASYIRRIHNNESGGAIGYIFRDGEQAIAILDEDTAEYRELEYLFEPSGNTFAIDLNYEALEV
jgi:hypothetical protein